MDNESQGSSVFSLKFGSALALSAFFFGVGATMIDTRPAFGVALCIFGAGCVAMLYRAEIKSMRFYNIKGWPWLAAALAAFQIITPVYLITSKATAEPNGPVITDDARKCPNGYNIFSQVEASDNGKSGFSFPIDAKICVVDAKAYRNGQYGVELRPIGK